MKEPKPRRKFGVILRILSAKNKKICWAPKKFYFLQIFIFTKKITQTGQFIFVIHHGMRQIHKIIEIYRIITSPMKCKWKTLSIFYKIKKNSTFTYFQNTKKNFRLLGRIFRRISCGRNCTFCSAFLMISWNDLGKWISWQLFCNKISCESQRNWFVP